MPAKQQQTKQTTCLSCWGTLEQVKIVMKPASWMANPRPRAFAQWECKDCGFTAETVLTGEEEREFLAQFSKDK